MIAIAAALAALLFACWILFNLAVYALPFFVAVSAGMLAYETGSGAVGATLVALFAGAAALVFGQTLFSVVRTPALRAVIAALYAAPAAFAGYHAVHGLVATGSPSATWHELLSIAGAVVIGLVAWGRAWARSPEANRAGRRKPQVTPTPFKRADAVRYCRSSSGGGKAGGEQGHREPSR